jgi:outer membrane protein TolC
VDYPSYAALELNSTRIASINQLQAQDELLDRQIATEKTKKIPTLGLEGFLGANQFSNSFNPVHGNSWYGASYLGLSAKWKLLSGENRGNHMRQLSIQKTSVAMQIDEQTQLVEKELRELDAKIKTQHLTMDSVSENVALLRESLEILQERLNAGKIEPNEVNSLKIDLQKEVLKQQNLRQQLQLNILKRLYTAGQL